MTSTLLTSTNLGAVATISGEIPGIVPSTATRILVYSYSYCGHTGSNDIISHLRYYVVDGDTTYEKYLLMNGNVWHVDTNSDNMWFPMPSNRMFYIEVPTAIHDTCYTGVNVIGYI